MNVLQPGMLALLAAAVIPILIHLYNRKRAVRRRFPPIEFLLASNRKLARRLKVRQLVLLAVRVGVFGLLPLAIAKPYILSDSGTTVDERLPAATVFVVDDSLSMTQGGGDSAWSLAQSRVADRIDEMRDIDEAALVWASDPDDAPVPQLTDDLRIVAEAVDEHDASAERGDLRRALEVARDIALTSELPVRRVVLVTDRARGSWPEALGDEIFHGSASVELIDVGPKTTTANLAITDATWGPDPGGGADRFEVRATITGFGLTGPQETEVELTVDGSPVASATAELSPDEPRVELVFGAAIDSPTANATLSLGNGGSVPADDERHLVLTGTRQVRVLLINGDPRPQPLQDELFFLERALRPGAESRSPILPRVTTPEGLSIGALEEADVAVLSNVGSLPAGQVAQLQDFVRGGGGLFITMGDRVDPNVANAAFGELLPKPLRNLKKLTGADDPDAAIKVTRIDQVTYGHPVFRPFALPGGESLQQVEVSSYMLLEPNARGDAKILASYADGGPAIVERTLGAGRIVLFTSSIDRDWSSLPLRKAFVPFVQRLATYLARRGAGSARDALVGEPYVLALDGVDAESVRVVDDLGATVASFDADDLRLTPNPSVTLRAPGHYALRIKSGGIELDEAAIAFAANPDPLEFTTELVDEDALEALWAAPQPDGTDDSVYGGGRERRVELWPILLLTVLILLYLETLVGFRRSFIRRLTGRGKATAEG